MVQLPSSPWQPSRKLLESCLVAGTFARVGQGLLTSGLPGCAAGLGFLTLSTSLQEAVSAYPWNGYGYCTRETESSGIMLGALALPWAFAGLAVTAGRQADSGELPCNLWGALAASAAMVSLLCHRSGRQQRNLAQKQEQTNNNRSSPSKHNQTRTKQRTARQISSEVDRGDANKHKQLADEPHLCSSYVGTLQTDAAPAPISCRPGEDGPVSNGVVSHKELRGSKSPITALQHLVPAATIAGPLLVTILCLLYDMPSTGMWQVSRAAAIAAFLLNAALGLCILDAMLGLLPYCFSIGEAMVLAQGLSLLVTDAALLLLELLLVFAGLPSFLGLNLHPPSLSLAGIAAARRQSEAALFVELLSVAVLAAAFVASPLLAALRSQKSVQRQRRRRGWPLIALTALWAIAFATSTICRRCLVLYWASLLGLALPAMGRLSASRALPTILVRKGYHVLAVALFVPALALEPHLLALALGIAFALLVLLEVVRLARYPGLGDRIHSFMIGFTDGRDTGVLLISHFSLLLGMAVPIWLALPQASDDAVPLPAYAGILILGIADTAASTIGRALGRHPICSGSPKTVEGTLGGAICTLAGWALLMIGVCSRQWEGLLQCQMASWAAIILATVAACLLEAATTQLDNLFIPLHYFVLLAV